MALDMYFGPSTGYLDRLYGLDTSGPASIPFWLFIGLFGKVIPVWILQKIILFFTFFLCGLGAYRLLPGKSVGTYFAGVLYTVNPFTYARLMAGQWGILLAYAITPFAVKAFIDLMTARQRKNIVVVPLLLTLAGMLQPHALFLILLTFLILFIVKVVVKRRERENIIQTSKYVGISAGLFCALNLYWIIPLWTAKDNILGQLGQAALLLFAPKATSRILFDVASMQDFWRE